MAIDTKPNLNSEKFEQFSGDTLNLSGTTKIYGKLEYAGSAPLSFNGDTIVHKDYVDAQISTGVTASNGLSKVGKNIVLGGILTGNTEISGGGFNLNLGKNSSKLNIISATTTNQQVYTSNVITADNTSAAFQFIDDTGTDSAGSYVAMFEKKWTGGGTPDGNNAGYLNFVMPSSTLVRRRALQIGWNLSPTTNGNEYTNYFTQGLYSGTSVNILRLNAGDMSIGHLSQSIGSNDVAVGIDAKTWNGGQIALGYRAGKTSGAAMGRLYPISIGYNANQGTYPIGSYSIAIGNGAIAKSGGTISMGYQAGNTTGSGGDSTISIGYNANQGTSSVGNNSVAIGLSTKSIGDNSVAIGNSAIVNSIQGIAIGLSTTSSGQGTVALGASSKAVNYLSLAIGAGAGSTSGTDGSEAVTVGAYANDGTSDIGQRSVAIGAAAKSKTARSISMGYQAGNTTGTDGGSAVSIGDKANQGTSNIGANSIAIGSNSESIADSSIALGYGSLASGGTSNIAIGTSSKARNQLDIALGYGANVNGSGGGNSSGIGIGGYVVSTGTSATAIGYFANSSGMWSHAIGRMATTKSQDQISIGTLAGKTTGIGGIYTISIGRDSNGGAGTFNMGGYSVAVGAYSLTKSNYSTTIGYLAGNTTGTTGDFNVAVGYAAGGGESVKYNIGTAGISIGAYSKSINAHSISIGYNSTTSGGTSYSVAIGRNTISKGDGSLAIGYGMRANNSGSIMLGYANTFINNSIDNSFALGWGTVNEPDYHLIKGTLTTNTATESTLLSYTLKTGSTYSFKATVKARETTGADRALYEIKTFAYREGGGAVIEGTTPYDITVVESTGATTWNGTMDVSGNDIRIRVTGETAKTIKWHVILEVQKNS